ncbi:hypothetical protein MRX96_031571 [Rhipicephalus microplus]
MKPRGSCFQLCAVGYVGHRTDSARVPPGVKVAPASDPFMGHLMPYACDNLPHRSTLRPIKVAGDCIRVMLTGDFNHAWEPQTRYRSRHYSVLGDRRKPGEC